MDEEFFNQYWWVIVLVAVWELVWKGAALWRAARNNSKSWFVILLIVNSVAILPIAYLFIFSKQSPAAEDK